MTAPKPGPLFDVGVRAEPTFKPTMGITTHYRMGILANILSVVLILCCHTMSVLLAYHLPRACDKFCGQPPIHTDEFSQIGNRDMSHTELVNLPEIGAVVRSNISCCNFRKGSSGRVKAILYEGDGPTVVIQPVCGKESTVSKWEYSRFFEECDSQDLARAYWASI